MGKPFAEKTFQHFERITDPRTNRGKNHSLPEMIFLTLCATICGADSWADVERYGKAKLDWLRQFVPFEGGIPSHDTLGRVFARLDSVEFYACLHCWVVDICQGVRGQTVALDGKMLRGSFDRASEQSPLHSVSAWVCGLKMCLGLKSVDDKSNEIPAVQELIAMLDLEGAIITADAMHCQRETAKAIIDKKADYLLMAKGNQPALSEALNQTLLKAMESDDGQTRRISKTRKSRNREETQEVVVMRCPGDHPLLKQWPSLQTIGVIHRRRECDGKIEEASETFITSLPCKVRSITQHLGNHCRRQAS